MSFDAWVQLEYVSGHLDDLRHRLFLARAMGNAARAAQLTDEIGAAEARRDRLVEWIVCQVAEAADGDPADGPA